MTPEIARFSTVCNSTEQNISSENMIDLAAKGTGLYLANEGIKQLSKANDPAFQSELKWDTDKRIENREILDDAGSNSFKV